MQHLHSIAEDVTGEALNVISKKISEFTSNLIPGEGHTEASIALREGYSPDFSILGVREIAPIDDGKFFTQFSLFNTEAWLTEKQVEMKELLEILDLVQENLLRIIPSYMA